MVDCITILLCQSGEELVPWERTPWHWSKHVKFRPSWLLHKGCLSLHCWQTEMLPTCWHIELIIPQHTQLSPPFFHWDNWEGKGVQTLLLRNSPWAGLGQILAVACATTEKHKWLCMYIYKWYLLSIHIHLHVWRNWINQFGAKQGCCPLQAWSFPALLPNCNVATCWHLELCTLDLLHLSFSIHPSTRFSCSIKVFHLSTVMFFFNVPGPIHWVHAYSNASACIRRMERMPALEFP